MYRDKIFLARGNTGQGLLPDLHVACYSRHTNSLFVVVGPGSTLPVKDFTVQINGEAVKKDEALVCVSLVTMDINSPQGLQLGCLV